MQCYIDKSSVLKLVRSNLMYGCIDIDSNKVDLNKSININE